RPRVAPLRQARLEALKGCDGLGGVAPYRRPAKEESVDGFGTTLGLRKGWAMPHQQFWFPTRQDFLGLNIPTDIVDLSKMRCPREGKWRGETCGHLRPR